MRSSPTVLNLQDPHGDFKIETDRSGNWKLLGQSEDFCKAPRLSRTESQASGAGLLGTGPPSPSCVLGKLLRPPSSCPQLCTDTEQCRLLMRMEITREDMCEITQS